ncbi:DUF2800 domain-containing protein [Anaerotignum sp.]|uniref:DUF2800 domain-containing protein n=1 Tax=Anaerotignum sp. TaxID=2039241 RepID=UPI00331BFA68
MSHALLSASSAEKWLHCTPSARMESSLPDTAGESAQEGSLAHELAELKARRHFHGMDKGAFTRKFNKIKNHELYAVDMDNYTDDYVEYLKDVEMMFSSKPYAVFETKVDYSHIAPEGFGTADCIMIGGGYLHIVDFKYGKTVQVDCVENPQMKLYALGALKKYGLLYCIEHVVLHIVQPRMSNISSCDITCQDLKAWGESIKPVGLLAYDGAGECIVGEWCDNHFCKCRATCRAYMSQMQEVVPFVDKLPPVLTDEEVGYCLTLATNIKKWYSILEKHAMTALLAGKDITGWKVVEGRSNRAFNDTDAAYKALSESGIDEALLYKRVPITLTDCEKMLGKKEFTEKLADFVVKPPGKPTIAPLSDPREHYNPAMADFAGLESNN